MDSNLITNEKNANVQTLERCFTIGIDREMGSLVEKNEDRIDNVILTAIDNFIPPKIELAVRSKMLLLNRTPLVLQQIQNVGNI